MAVQWITISPAIWMKWNDRLSGALLIKPLVWPQILSYIHPISIVQCHMNHIAFHRFDSGRKEKVFFSIRTCLNTPTELESLQTKKFNTKTIRYESMKIKQNGIWMVWYSSATIHMSSNWHFPFFPLLLQHSRLLSLYTLSSLICYT